MEYETEKENLSEKIVKEFLFGRYKIDDWHTSKYKVNNNKFVIPNKMSDIISRIVVFPSIDFVIKIGTQKNISISSKQNDIKCFLPTVTTVSIESESIISEVIITFENFTSRYDLDDITKDNVSENCMFWLKN
jgi:hypothetical protein